MENKNFALDLVGKKKSSRMVLLFHLIFNYRFCMLFKEEPYHGTATDKVFYIQGNVVRMFLWDFYFTWKSCKNYAKIRQKVTHWNIMQTCVHVIRMKPCITIMRFFFRILFMQFIICVKFILFFCDIRMNIITNSYEN